jgi:hypothetical protein
MNSTIIDIIEYGMLPPAFLSGSEVIRQLIAPDSVTGERKRYISLNIGLELMNILSSSHLLYAVHLLHHEGDAGPGIEQLQACLFFLFVYIIENHFLHYMIVKVRNWGQTKQSRNVPIYIAMIYFSILFLLLLYTHT